MNRKMRQKNPFVDLFQQQIDIARKAATSLADFFSYHGDRQPESSAEQIVRLEHEGDRVVGEIHNLVDRTFIPPYDKPDILNLGNYLDNITDEIKSVVGRRGIFRLQKSPENQAQFLHALEFCNLIIESVEKLSIIINRMPEFDSDQLRNLGREINSLEDDADAQRDIALRELFGSPDMQYTVRMEGWRQVFERLEAVTDHCQHAVNAIMSIARRENK